MKIQFTFTLLLFATGLKAQQTDTTKLNEIVIAENRLQTPFNKLARNIQVVTAQQIAALPVKSINEVLAYVAGVDVRQRGPFGSQADISIDGGTFEQTLILLNGVKISDAQTAHHSMNIPVPLAAIERIEVLKGPAARIYGVNALTGAINIVTKKAAYNELAVNAQVGTSFEQKDIKEGDGIYGGNSIQVGLNLVSKNTEHLFALSSNEYNGQRYNTSTNDERLFYNGSLNFDAKNSINLMGGYIANAFGANGFYAAPGDKEAFEVVKTALVSLGSAHQMGERFTLRPRVSGRYNWDDYRYYRNDLSKARSLHETEVWAAELNSTLYTAIGDFGFGLESRSEQIQSTNIGTRERFNHGAYAEYKNDEISRLNFILGAYLNYNTQYGWQAFPGLDIAYLASENWKLAFNVGSSQRIPSFTDLYLNQRPGNIGNANLVSENAWQYEGVLAYKNGGFKAQAGYFYRDIANFIDWVRTSSAVPYQPQNFGNNKVNGFNLSFGQLLNLGNKRSFLYNLSYNYLAVNSVNYASNVTSKYVLDNLKHQALLRVVYSCRVWQATLGNRWIQRAAKDAYLITDLRLQYRENIWAFYAEATNLFNKEYIEVAAVPMPKRWFALGANLKLKL